MNGDKLNLQTESLASKLMICLVKHKMLYMVYPFYQPGHKEAALLYSHKFFNKCTEFILFDPKQKGRAERLHTLSSYLQSADLYTHTYNTRFCNLSQESGKVGGLLDSKTAACRFSICNSKCRWVEGFNEQKVYREKGGGCGQRKLAEEAWEEDPGHKKK